MSMSDRTKGAALAATLGRPLCPRMCCGSRRRIVAGQLCLLASRLVGSGVGSRSANALAPRSTPR